MKKCVLAAIVALSVVLAGCGSVPDLASGVISAGQSVKAAAQSAEAVDFKSGEVLCSDGTKNDAEDMWFHVGTILTPASAATKNQAEALFVGNGEKVWSSFVVPTHKAQTAELVVGKQVFAMSGYTDYDAKNMSASDYRQGQWELVRVTSVDELFKKRVEVNGNKYDPGLIRVPDLPLD